MIKLQCACGHTLQLPERLVGQKIRCKQCGKVMRVPGAGGAPAGPAAPQEPVDDSRLLVQGSRACPGCGRAYPPTAVICVDCGLNIDTGAMLYASLEEGPGRPPLAQGGGQPAPAPASLWRRILGRLGLG